MVSRLASSAFSAESVLDLTDSCVKQSGLRDDERPKVALGRDNEIGDEGGVEHISAHVHELGETAMVSRLASSVFSAEPAVAISFLGGDNEIVDHGGVEQPMAPVHEVGDSEMGSQLGRSAFSAEPAVAISDSCVECCGQQEEEKQKAAFSRHKEIGGQSGVEQPMTPVHELGETEMVSRLASSAFSAQPAVAISVLGRDNETGDQRGVQHTSAPAHELGDSEMGYQLASGAFSAESAVAISGSYVERCGSKRKRNKSRLSVVTKKLVIKVVWNSQWHLYMNLETLKLVLDWRAVPSQQSRY
jgi:hypothetical protein